MATITLEYDARNINFKKLIDVLVSIGAKVVQPQPKTKRCSLDLAIEEIEQGKGIRCKDFNDYLKQVNA